MLTPYTARPRVRVAAPKWSGAHYLLTPRARARANRTPVGGLRTPGAQIKFFNASLALLEFFKTPAAVTAAAAAKQGLTLAALQQAFGGANMVGLSCTKSNGNVMLNMVELCFNRDDHGIPTERVACPAATLLASDYDNGCATKATPGELIFVDQPCGSNPPPPPPGPPSPPGPAPPAPPGAQCVPDQHGPACTSDADCTSIPHCVRCAHSGFCTTYPKDAAVAFLA